MKTRGHGTAQKASRYSKLKQELDEDLFNNNWIEINTTKSNLSHCSFNFVDLFAGAGGLSLGFIQSGFNSVFSNEIEKFAVKTLQRNFPNSVHIAKPIEELGNEEILEVVRGKQIHLVVGGPPCQGFSVAGKRNPNDPRNRLFTEYLRVINLLKPDYLLMENVPGILTMQGGRVKEEIISSLSEIGYGGCAVRILEAATFGVPQLRTRAIFIANRHGLPNPYPQKILDRQNYIPIEDAIEDLKEMERNPKINHEWTDHSKQFENRISKVPPGGSLYKTYRDAFKRQHLGVPSMAIKENHGGTHIHPTLNRCISAREMARLQTFPDDYIFEGSHKKAFIQIGNAVPVLLAKHLALALYDQLHKHQN